MNNKIASPNGPKTVAVNQPIDITKTSNVKCESCGGITFQEGVILRRVSALLTETGKEGFLPVSTFVCCKCAHVNQEFLPTQIRDQVVTTSNIVT